MKCLDSTLLAAYTRGRDSALEYVESHRDEALFLPTIALYEMFYGATSGGTDVTLDELSEALDWGSELALSAEHAAEAAGIRRGRTERDGLIPHPGLLIAGAARNEGMAVVTGHSHFDRVDELAVERF